MTSVPNDVFVGQKDIKRTTKKGKIWNECEGHNPFGTGVESRKTSRKIKRDFFCSILAQSP